MENDTIVPSGIQVPEASDLAPYVGGEADLPTFGGRMSVRWDPDARVTSVAGLAHFGAFLANVGLFDRMAEDAPFDYRSNNACSKRDILGTAVLAILLGKTRYVHVNELRHDEAARQLLALGEIVSEDTVRRAFRNADEGRLDAWLSKHEREVFEALVSHRYVIDVDSTVKPVYGHQEGAELGYNPAKPGRPSHNYHSYFIGRARIALGVDVRPGKQHSGGCGMPRLWALVDSLPERLRPALVRGDVGYGSDATMREAEKRGIPYLFKVRRSRVIRSLFGTLADDPRWKGCGSGWEAFEMRVRLDAWERERRVLFVRRPAERKVEAVAEKPRKAKAPKRSKALVPTVPAAPRQAEFDFVKDLKGREWDYCALVTNDEAHDATALSQLYRDRGDCENNFDELKNQWGWAGFTTKRIKPCRAMARLIAVVANWWNVFCRMADPTAHREAVTSRPAFLHVMGRIVESGRRRTIHLTSAHADNAFIRKALDNVAAFFNWLGSTAPQSSPDMRWQVVVRHAFRHLLIPDPALRDLLPIR